MQEQGCARASSSANDFHSRTTHTSVSDKTVKSIQSIKGNVNSVQYWIDLFNFKDHDDWLSFGVIHPRALFNG
jgi:hypothetical protein